MSEKILSLRPSRPSLVKYLDTYIKRAHTRGGQVGLMVLQIKRGHDFGALFGYHILEALLEQFAERLNTVCRKDDRIIRIG
ncbi:MAG: diguanylate cyclase, partial [Gammaproteobacteria bacterium]|nr:diguanylate cyclase [Gammaproteobacteria bacterium]